MSARLLSGHSDRFNEGLTEEVIDTFKRRINPNYLMLMVWGAKRETKVRSYGVSVRSSVFAPRPPSDQPERDVLWSVDPFLPGPRWVAPDVDHVGPRT